MKKKFDYKNQHVLEEFVWPEVPRCHFHPGVKEWTDGVLLPTGTGMLVVDGHKYCPACAHREGLITKKTLDELDNMQAEYDMEQMMKEQNARKQSGTDPKLKCPGFVGGRIV